MARARGSLVFQLKERMNGMTAFGCSKYADKQLNHGKPAKDRIYSYKTFHNYLTVGCAFLKYVRAEHPGIKNLDDTRQYVEEYLTKRIEHGLSAWTVRLDAAALAKVFQCSCYDFGVSLPSRNRSEITKNKTHSCEGHFSLDKNKKQVDFCLGTGLRRSELMKVTPEQVVQKEAGVWLMGIKGKGGRVRDVPVDPQYAARIREIAQEARDAGRCRIYSSESIKTCLRTNIGLCTPKTIMSESHARNRNWIEKEDTPCRTATSGPRCMRHAATAPERTTTRTQWNRSALRSATAASTLSRLTYAKTIRSIIAQGKKAGKRFHIRNC